VALPPRVARGVSIPAAAAIAATTVGTTSTSTTATATVALTRGSAAESAAIARASLRGATETATAAAAAGACVLSEVAIGTCTSAPAATTTTAATVRRLASNCLKEAGHFLVGFLQEINKLSDDTTIAAVEKGSRNTRISSTAGTTNAVDIVVNVRGEVVVDDVRDIGDIKATSGNCSGNQDRAASIAEELESPLTLSLSAITVDRRGREILVDQEVRERVGHTLGLDKDERQATTVRVENIQKNGALVDILNVLDLLRDVLRGRSNTSNRQEDIVLQEVPGEHLNVAGECGREHERLTFLHTRHVFTLDDAANLGLETHVKHTVSLVQDEVLDVLQGDATSFYEINQSARCGNKQVTSALDLAELAADISTSVDDAGTNPRSVGELASFVVDLRDQLSSGGEDERGRIGFSLSPITAASLRNNRRAIDEGLREDGEQEAARLARTSLSTGHEVAAAHDDGN